MKYYVLDTFAGAGGFSLGFEKAGCEIIGAIEIDKWASETFAYNHPNAIVLNDDITKLNNKDLIKSFKSKKPNIILGGPPCQGFSICNKNAGDPKHPINTLFRDFIRVGSIFEPDILIMENVPNLIKAKTHSKKFVIDIITGELQKIGYFVYSKILQATDYGIPQIRKRLFVIASKKELHKPFPKETHYISNGQCKIFPEELIPCPSLWEAISDLPPLEAGEGNEMSEYQNECQNEYQSKIKGKSKILFNHKAMNHTKRMIERFSKMSWGQSAKDAPEHLRPRKRNSSEIADKIYDQNNRRMYPHKPCHTIPASFYANFVHPYQHRNFTAREGARIQSFPDSFRFMGKPTVVSHKLLAREGRFSEKYLCQYNQIGNAVPPMLAQAIAENILKQI
ncbi:DNA-cytosine methyltransferase [Desulfonema limicola]|uniref:Cytosine-specific methyltransferase n=1 Tax=Desulfonema limicola TaxID=45656 RepID=A0A975B952_9BACT|nr:DNA cytosine methyltransferase [Desulfonema limicola]QTA80961.1 DNA-cytosine methyltransferase [Desulfonema limicola]